MKQTLLMLCAAFVSLTAVAQPVPEKAPVDNDAFNWPIGHKAKVLTKDVWLPRVIETYDEQGHFLFKDEYTLADNGDILTVLITNADGSMTRTTRTYDDNGWDNGYIYEKYYKGKWVVSQKRTYVNDKWGNTAEDVNLYYDADNDSERIQGGDKRTYSRDTLENGDTKFRYEAYNWNSNSESWDKSNYSTREEHLDFLGRCTDIVEENHNYRSNNGTLTTTRFSYKDDGDNKPYQCSTSYQFLGGARDSFTVTIDNIQWGKYTKPVRSNNPLDWVKIKWIKQGDKYLMHQDNVLSGAYIYKRGSSTDWKDVYVGQIYTHYDSINGFEYHQTSNITDGSLNARDYSERLEKEEQTGKYVITTRDVTYQDNYNDGRYSNGDIPVSIDERSNYTEGFFPTYTFKGYNSEFYNGGRLTSKRSWNVTNYNKEYECWQERVYYRKRFSTDGLTRETEKVTKYQFFPAQSSGITSMPSQTEAGNAVYNLQGLKVGDTLKNQPAGIYIVKQGGKSFKVVKEK